MLPTGSALLPVVNDALGAILNQGTFAATARRWLSTDLSALPLLR